MILFLLILILVAGGILAWAAGRSSGTLSRWVAVAAVLADFLIVLYLWISKDFAVVGGSNGWVIEYRQSWIERFGIELHLALDGLNIVLLALTYFLGILSVFVSWTQVKSRTGFFHLNLLWTMAGITGVFISLDLFLFYFFWELMLVPMYFLIAIWGHENRLYASYKFFIFTQASGLLMFASILGIYFVHGSRTGIYTFDLMSLAGTPLSRGMAWLLMGGFMIAFLVKLPAVPFHSWLPDAHTEAPTAGSVLLAGLLLKTGAYGLLRVVLPLFPGVVHAFAPFGMMLGLAGILYGAKLAFAQDDLKRMVAYTSVSHMGFVMLGVFALNELAFQGVVMQIVAHGIATGTLFMIAGILQERTHTRSLDAYGGFWTKAPAMGGVTLIFALASLGLPGMAAFVAEFLILLGAFRASVPIAVVASAGLIVSVLYSLRLFQRTFYGKTSTSTKIWDLNIREVLIMVPSIVLIFWFGLFPKTIFNVTEGPVSRLLNQYYCQEAPDRTTDEAKPSVSYTRAEPSISGGQP
jgi:NADH-quinone oxidoreductase subunit M